MKESQLTAAGDQLPEVKCVVCGHPLDAATCLEGDHRPAVGDVSMCVECGEVYEFDAQMKLVQVNLASLLELDPTQHNLIAKAQSIIREKRYFK